MAVIIACEVQGGVELRLMRSFDDGVGVKMCVPSGESVILNGPRGQRAGVGHHAGGGPVTTEVPEEFWTAWLEQNPDHPLLANGAVRRIEGE